MKRLLFLTVFALILLSHFTRFDARTTVRAAPDCESAYADCKWKASDEFAFCILYQPSRSMAECNQQAMSIYNGCMRAWGCSGYIPRSGGDY